MQTNSAAAGPATNFTVARLRQDFANRSNVGAIFVGRSATGTLADDHGTNRSYAVDGRLGVGQQGTISGFAAETETPGSVTSDTHAYGALGNYSSERYRFGGGTQRSVQTSTRKSGSTLVAGIGASTEKCEPLGGPRTRGGFMRSGPTRIILRSSIL